MGVGGVYEICLFVIVMIWGVFVLSLDGLLFVILIGCLSLMFYYEFVSFFVMLCFYLIMMIDCLRLRLRLFSFVVELSWYVLMCISGVWLIRDGWVWVIMNVGFCMGLCILSFFVRFWVKVVFFVLRGLVRMSRFLGFSCLLIWKLSCFIVFVVVIFW